MVMYGGSEARRGVAWRGEASLEGLGVKVEHMAQLPVTVPNQC